MTFDFLQAARYTDRDKRLPHQDAAWAWAWGRLSKEERQEFTEMFRADPPEKEPLRGERKVLNGVPYFSQRDAASSRDAPRMCYSSTMAMMLEYLKPGTLQGANGDDQYLKHARRFGDDQTELAQTLAMKSFGVAVEITKTADLKDIEEEIERGRPVPCGVLHHGPANAPRGGGHWLLVIGYTDSHLVVHDPYGEMDLVNGGYINSKGKALHYSKANFRRRWSVAPTGGGAYRMADRHGWMYRLK